MPYDPDQLELIEGIALAPPDRFPYDYGLMVRRITRSTDQRTIIAMPWARSLHIGIGHNALLIGLDTAREAALWCAALNSVVFDYLARQSVSQSMLSQYDIEQLPVPTIDQWEVQRNSRQTIADYCIERVVALTYTAHCYREWAEALIPGVPMQRWQAAEVRLRLKAEIDAEVARLHELQADEVRHIYSTFPIWQRQEEQQYGTFRSRDLVLGAFDS